jgi:hypothetical protein
MSTTSTTLEVTPATIKINKKRRIVTLPVTREQQAPHESKSTETSTVVLLGEPPPSENLALVPDTNQDPLQGPGFKQMEEDIRHTHLMAIRSSLDILLGAAKCGLLLKLGKEIAGHGNFEKWVSNRDLGFSKMTRSNYMRLADHLTGLGKSKSVLLLTVELNKEQQLASYSFDEDALKAIVIEVSNGRSLMDLYVHWNIIKSSPTQSVKSSNAPSGAEVFKRMLVSLDGLPNMFSNLKADQKSFLIEKIESILTALKSSNPDENAQ